MRHNNACEILAAIDHRIRDANNTVFIQYNILFIITTMCRLNTHSMRKDGDIN